MADNTYQDGSLNVTDPTAAVPWTDSDLTNARTYFQQYMNARGGMGTYGNVDDPIRAYQTARRGGMSHDAALSNALSTLGWDKVGLANEDPGPTTTSGGGAGGPGDGTTLGSLTAPFTEQFTPPGQLNNGGPNGLNYLMPLPQFKAPTLDDMLQDPSYKFRVGQGEQALEQSAAARGVLNTGGTLKDILNYGQSAGSQEFGQIWDRNLQGYNAGLNAWNAFAPVAQRQDELNYSRAYDKYLQDYNVYRNQKNDTFAMQYPVASA